MEINLFNIVVVLGSILVSITLHEAMHAYVSHWLGDDTAFHEGRLTLNPLAHIDPFATILLPLILVAIGAPPFGAAKPVPFNPYRIKGGEWGAALVGVAGPLTNLVLAALGGLLMRFLGTGVDPTILTVLDVFVGVNVAFFLFNMIPFPPLDGSRVLYAIAPDGIRSLMRGIEGMGLIGIVLFMFLLFPLIRPLFSEIFINVYSFILGT